MAADSQIFVPDSFCALFTDKRTQRLLTTRQELIERYEICEDLAQTLTEIALQQSHGGAVSEQAVLQGFLTSLSQPESGLRADEAGWVVQRLAELLNWPAPI